MNKERYVRHVWINLLKDFVISFGVGAVVVGLSKNEFFAVQVIYVSLFLCTLTSTINIYSKMNDGVEEGIPFLQINLAHKIILFCTLIMGIASITIIPMSLMQKTDNPYGVLFLVILVLVVMHYFIKWWNNKAEECNHNRIQQYVDEEKAEIDKVVNYLLLHASDELLFEVLKDRVNYDCVYDENYKIISCKTLYLIDLGITELQEPLRLAAYKKACTEQYRYKKWEEKQVN